MRLTGLWSGSTFQQSFISEMSAGSQSLFISGVRPWSRIATPTVNGSDFVCGSSPLRTSQHKIPKLQTSDFVLYLAERNDSGACKIQNFSRNYSPYCKYDVFTIHLIGPTVAFVVPCAVASWSLRDMPKSYLIIILVQLIESSYSFETYRNLCLTTWKLLAKKLANIS